MARRGLAAAVAIGCVFVLSGATASAAGEEIVVESTPLSSATAATWIDPAAATSNQSLHLINATCLPLLGFDDVTGRLDTDAAAAMPIVSDDGKTYTFTVPSGHAFSDGESVTPASFKRAFERATSPAMATSLSGVPPPWRAEVAQIAGAQAFFDGEDTEISGIDVTATTISITLLAETPGFLRRLVPHMCATPSTAPAGFSTGPLPSAGPYYVTTASDSEVVLDENPNYGGGRVREPGLIRWVPHESALVEDYVADAPSTYVPAVDALDVRNPTTWVERFILTTHRPPFDNPNIRKAVAFALDRTRLSEDSGILAPTEQLLAPLMPGHERASIYPLDDSGADEALALMGGATPTVDLCYTEDNPAREAIAEAAQTHLEDVGFTVNLQPHPAGTLFGTLLPAGDMCELGLLALATLGDPAPPLASFFHSDRIPPGGSNFSFYSDPVLDARLDAAEALRPDATRLAEWGSIDVAITEAAPTVVVGTRVRRDVTADRIGCRYPGNVVWGYPVNRLCVQSVEQEAAEGTVYVVNTDEDPEGVGACDAEECTLREAITAANDNPGPDTIVFAIGAGGHQTIVPLTALPEITGPITIDGTTQPGFTGTPIVEIDGSTVAADLGGDGLLLSGGSSTVRGLVINRFDGDSGIVLDSDDNVVEGNYVGTDPTGNEARPNGTGVDVQSSDNTIGGTSEASRNVISGNDSRNIEIAGEGVGGNTVSGNYIGTTASGIGLVGGDEGIEISGGARDNSIGGGLLQERNVIAGHSGNGVTIVDNLSTGNVVEGNYIGLGATGLAAVGNGGAGVELLGPDAPNTVRDNWITGNIDGVVVGGNDTGTSGQIVESNRIGLTTGVLVEGNTGRGIYVNGRSSGTTSDISILSNTIAGSGGAGIFIDATGGVATGNLIRFNSIEQNGELGIDLVEDVDGFAISGVTQNDAGDADTGPNGLQNFPVLTSATVGADTTAMEGNLSSTPNTTFTVDFYANDVCDPSEHGEGQLPVGAAGPVTTDENGVATFVQVVAGALGPTAQVTATATDVQSADTSEFSACLAVEGAPQTGPTFTVNTTADMPPADAGCTFTDCTLREAIQAANDTVGPNTIEFDIPGAAPHTIEPDSTLPLITDPLTIDGTTEPDYFGTPVVELDGTTVTDSGSLPGSGLRIATDNSVVRGLAINRFSASGPAAGVHIQGDNNTVESSYIGTDITGTLARPNGIGIELTGASTENVIGGSAAARNVISGNNDRGVSLLGGAADTLIAGNYIGLDATGMDPLGNGVYGIQISATGSNIVSGNLITDNASGVIISGAASQRIESNGIGVNEAGDVLGQLGVGVSISNSSGNSIVSNTIAGHTDAGILVDEFGGDATGNVLSQNSIKHNVGLGIDLVDSEPRGVTENDLNDEDGGANELQNFPELTSAVAGGIGTTVEGTLHSTSLDSFDLDFFSNATCDPSGNGEGATYLSSQTVVTGEGGTVSFTESIPSVLAVGTQVTATATGPDGTSEFSACVEVLQAVNIYTVDSSADGTPGDCNTGGCTLREAISAANGDSTPSVIGFELGDPDIALGSPLPMITEPVTIDGNNQTEAGPIVIDGSESGGDGLVLFGGSDGSVIHDLHLTGFDTSGSAAIRVFSSGNFIEDNRISFVYDGIVVTGDEAAGNTIGGSFTAGEGNRLWNFSHYAIELDTSPAGNTIAGNTIGIDPSGVAQVLQPGSTGIFATDTPGAIIGHNVGPGGLGAIDGSRSNVIVRTTFGIFFESGVTGSIVAGNFVGVNRTGVATNLGATSTGIELSGASDSNQLGPGNNVAHNGSHGIRINHSDGNRIVANSIRSNGGLGISLNSANNGIVAPSLSTAVDNEAGAATVSGEIEGPSGLYFVEFFENTSCDPSESGEGETYRGFAEVQITNNESRSFVANTFLGVAEGDILTATLTRALPPTDTSEFSLCTMVEVASTPPPAPVLFGAVADVDVPATPTSPLSLGVAGLVDSGQPTAGQEFDVEFFSTTACDPLAPRTSLGTGNDFVTNQTGIAGFAKDGLTNVEIGTIVVAFARRGVSEPSPMSNCVVADRNNTSWHTAHSMTPTDTETGALRAAGEARWFKVPILPNSRVEVSLSGLPADYDLIVFSDIQQAYERLVGTDVDPQLGPNLAVTDLQREGAETQTDVFNTSQYDSSSWDPTNWDPNLNTSVFSASQWSASQWSPSQWSASQWSASQWSPSQWSPSQWSASQWSASQWSPSQWSASQWSPSQWSSSNPADPRAFSSAQTASLLAVSAGPGTGDETVSVNTWNNTGDFYFRVQGKNGSFDAAEELSISVERQGSLCAGVLDQSSTPTAPAGLGAPKTLILKDTSRLDMDTPIGTDTLDERLDALAERPDVHGVVVDVDADDDLTNNVGDFTVRELNAQADAAAHRSCPFAKNLVAASIKRIVSAYRKAYPSIKYLVVVGDDTVIPFFRYPDPALLGSETLYVPPVQDDTTSQASLRLGYILSDDFMASSTSVSRHGKRLPVPDLSAGRLVETPQEIAGMLDAYLGTSGGVVPTPTSSLTTGYDFLTDAADEIAGHFEAGIGGTANRRLITEQTVSPGVTTPPDTAPTRDKSWTGDDLRDALLGPDRHDLIFLAGHFSANDALAADYKTNVLTTELAASSTDFENSIVFSAGCHAGYNIVNGHATVWTEPLDWAQAFAQKRATLISGTGYQYGDTDFLAHGERIYAEFARQLRVTTATGDVAVGSALLRAKQIFLEETPGLTSLDEKSLLQTTLFGLPMLSVNMPGERIVETPKVSIVDQTQAVGPGPGQALGLRFKGVNLGATLTPNDKQLKDGPLATWLEGPDGVAVRPTQPILPLRTFDVTPPDPNSALRGVGFRSGTYIDTGGTTPLTAAPATELRGIHGPFFSDVFFPTQPWSVNYFDALDGGATFLHTTPVQHRSESPEMTRRALSDLGLQLFYSANVTSYCPGTLPLVPTPPACVSPFGPVTAITPAFAAPPTISGIETSFADGELTFKARVVGDPSAGIQAVWVTWTIPPALGEVGHWAPVDLVRDADDPALWTGVLELDAGVDPGDVHFSAWAVNGVGRVTVDDNLGATYRPGSIPGNANTPPNAPDPLATQLTFTTPPPTSVTYGQGFAVTVRLMSEGSPLADRLVSIGIGPNGIPVQTDATGRATLQLQASLAPGSYDVEASFSGDATHASSDASRPIIVVPRPTRLTLGGTIGTTTQAGAPAVHAILEATSPTAPLHQRSVFVIFDGTSPMNSAVIEVFAGKTDPQGRVDVPSAFLTSLPPGTYRVDAYFNGVNVPGVLVLPPDSPGYAPATATGAYPNALGLLQQAADDLRPLASLPGARGDKAEDALMKVESAIRKLNRANPDRQGAMGDVEGAAGDLEAAVRSRLFTTAQTAQLRPIFDALTGAAWVTAVDARLRALARGGSSSKIAEAQAAINVGNQRWQQGRFKEAVASFKNAVAKADSA